MKKIRIYFYRADKSNHWMDKFISWWTGLHPANKYTPKYSHVEIGFPTGADEMYECWSSTMRGEFDGVRSIDSIRLLKNLERWDVFEFIVSDRYVDEILDRAHKLIGCRYDLLGILGFVPFGWLIHNPKKWYCSEFVYKVLTGKRKRISPRQLWKQVTSGLVIS